MVYRALDGSGGVGEEVVKITTVIDTIGNLSADVVADTSVFLTWTAPVKWSAWSGRRVRIAPYADSDDAVSFETGVRKTGMSGPAAAGSNESVEFGTQPQHDVLFRDQDQGCAR